MDSAQISDRELLELAAKAAGIATQIVGRGQDAYVQPIDESGMPFDWDPLTDDGDALRLAVKLRMTIRPEPAAVCAGWSVGEVGAPTGDGIGPWFWKEWHRAPGDESAATRRAIVRSAAAIGAKP